MTERLIQIKYNGIVSRKREETGISCSTYCDLCSQGGGNCEYVSEMIKKLAEYETAEEEGRLVVLPSNQVWESQGDIVYYIYDYEITECVNCGISICADGKAWIGLAADEDIFPYREPIAEFDTDPTDWCKKTTDVLALEWGKTVFLTREEAEKALKEMEKDDAAD